uniref:AlNc14C373G11138 protein n=1 Tax=Albugo laibachii Nc14 TaxID=890382 RepID=F0WY78_9STRA|nr:AlNc14C373G11138 [Albugo laibachii Nc14]|eukprot:CCA26430.1 AlNc14C373G11138 [Albugo laibachii Nc14]
MVKMLPACTSASSTLVLWIWLLLCFVNSQNYKGYTIELFHSGDDSIHTCVDTIKEMDMKRLEFMDVTVNDATIMVRKNLPTEFRYLGKVLPPNCKVISLQPESERVSIN